MSALAGTNGLLAYGAVFGILVACGLGVPLPEDISLIAGGFLAHKAAADVRIMMAVGFLGILAGDSLIFMAGRRLGSKVGRGGTGFFARIVTPEKRAKVEGLFHKHGEKIVSIARFLPGVRAVTYFTAGSAGMKYSRFILWDGLAALLSAPAFVYLGYHFGGELDFLIEKLKSGQVVVLGGMALIAVGYGLYRWRKSKADKARALASAAFVALAAEVVPPPPPEPVSPSAGSLSATRDAAIPSEHAAE